MSTLWTDLEKNRLAELAKEGKTAEEICVDFAEMKTKGSFGFPVKRSLRAIKGKLSELADEPEEFAPVEGVKTELRELEYLYKKYGEAAIVEPIGGGECDRFILSLSDIHIPFASPSRLVDILESSKDNLTRYNGIIVLNGDIMDQYGASNFSKFKDVTLLQEYKACFELVKLCTQYANKVVLVSGNHERRLSRSVREKLGTAVTSVIETDLLGRIANGEELDFYGNLKRQDLEMKSKVYYQSSESWYARVGKTIFCHPSAFSGAYPGGTVIKALEYFKNRYVPGIDFDAVVCGHTHKQYKGVVDNVLLIEQGSLAGRLGYEGRDDFAMGFSQQGYAFVWQSNDGRTNFNETNFWSFGRSLPKKKVLIS